MHSAPCSSSIASFVSLLGIKFNIGVLIIWILWIRRNRSPRYASHQSFSFWVDFLLCVELLSVQICTSPIWVHVEVVIWLNWYVLIPILKGLCHWNLRKRLGSGDANAFSFLFQALIPAILLITVLFGSEDSLCIILGSVSGIRIPVLIFSDRRLSGRHKLDLFS